MKKLNFAIMFFFFLTGFAHAEKVTWSEVSRQTLATSPSVKSAKLKLDNAELAYDRAVVSFLPDVSARGAYSRGETSGNNLSENFSLGLNATLSIFSGFETYNDVRQKSADLKAAKAAYNRAVSDAAYEVASQYANLMWAYETVELSKQIQERRTENKDMVKLKYNSGNVDIGSLKRVEADVETANYDLRKAQRYIETASAALLKAIGRNDEVILETDERLDVQEETVKKPNFNELIKNIPEYIAADYSAQSAKAASAKAKGSWFPNISLSGGVSRSGAEWLPDRKSWDAGVSVSYSLFTGGKRIIDINTASNQSEISQQSFINAQNDLKSRSIGNFNSLLDSFENIAVRKHYLAASQQQAEISAKKYVNGLSTYQDWYSIENDFINSQKSLLDAKKSAALERAKWNNFLGKDFESINR
ncbi:TolC family protein [Endomicrobium proavitum]|uniref:Outer membrane efflux protein n=1 Tax=Endomicrobium proavitum TaxID=1408281 RepID=A0A0G3WM26_9BACT|nr:TolC family protein [Endomicrobium proavitum]AKL98509.1 Outer membrane efflux protein [Endomicrobium proavitum]